MAKYDVLIKNGTIVTAADTFKADIGIKDEKIVEIGSQLQGDSTKVYDAKGKYLIPGGVDAHTHLDMPFGGTFSSDDFYTGTKAAAIGGTTAVVDFAVQPQGKTLHDTVGIWREKSDNKAVIDYGIHLAVTQMNDKTKKEIPQVISDGYSSFKVFMVYDNMRMDDMALIEMLKTASEAGGLVGVHCENYFAIKYLVEKLLSEGKVQPEYHAISRPDLCEIEAVNRAIKMAEIAKTPVHIVHVSCEESARIIKEAREKGIPVMGETCTQYLLLDESRYYEPDFNGAKYVMSPPLRDKKNNEGLWRMINNGVLQTIATDHCPFFMKQKEMGKDDFSKIPNGAPGIELRMALMYSEGVEKKRISLNKYVELTSTNSAKIFGMYPQKGTIAIGSDADIAVLDPNKEVTISKGMLHENVDYTPFEGFKVKGYPVATFSRGELIAENGEFLGEKGRGQFIKRGKGQVI
jgi:dihydropyrimidinase